MADTTLAQVEAAIQRALANGEEFAMGDIRRRTDLTKLLALRDQLRQEQNGNETEITLARFTTVKGEE